MDASVSNELVRRLLMTATKGGMRQHDFEKMSGKLQKNSVTDEQPNFRGALWGNYMGRKKGRMHCLSFNQWCDLLYKNGWINALDCTAMMLECKSVLMQVAMNRPKVRRGFNQYCRPPIEFPLEEARMLGFHVLNVDPKISSAVITSVFWHKFGTLY